MFFKQTKNKINWNVDHFSVADCVHRRRAHFACKRFQIAKHFATAFRMR